MVVLEFGGYLERRDNQTTEESKAPIKRVTGVNEDFLGGGGGEKGKANVGEEKFVLNVVVRFR